MSEKTMWQYLKRGLGRYPIDMTRHEDLIGVGVPDISYGADRSPGGGAAYTAVNGWIELKHVLRWAKAQNGALYVKVPWRAGQREWLLRRGTKGGHCFLLLKVGTGNNAEYFLMPSGFLPQKGWMAMRGWLLNNCATSWFHGGVAFESLFMALTEINRRR